MNGKLVKIKVIIGIILCFVQMVGINSIYAQENCGYIKGYNVEENVIIDAKEVEDFCEEFTNEYMEQYQIPGAAISIIQDGKVVFQKGYGYANLETKEPFTTDHTYFSIASITKTFTVLAVMQLVDEGKVVLDEDILTYLPTLHIDNPYHIPVTVKQLLTHTGGIDSSYTEDLSYEAVDNEKPHNLLTQINKRELHVVSKPGEFIEYSSYGTVLLGAIVEEVSGKSCESYMKEKLFEPLQMEHTVILNPDVKRIQGYVCDQNQVKPAHLKGYFRLYPEGGIVSCVQDMNHYIEMLLSKGRYNSQEVIAATLLEEMLSRQDGFDEVLPGVGLGFAEFENKGIKSIGHAGYAPDGTLSELVIYPNEHVGTFIVVNQGSNNNIQADFREAFVNEFILSQKKLAKVEINEKVAKENNVQASNMNVSTKELEGIYRFSDYSKTNIYKANTFGVGEVKVKALDEKRIVISGKDDFTFKPYEKNAIWVNELRYKLNDEETYFVFKQDEKGNINCMAETENSSHGIYEKLKWYEQARWQMPFFIGALLIYLLQLIGTFIFFIRGKIKRTGSKPSKENRIISIIAALNVGFFVYSMGFWGDRLRYCVPLDIKLSLTMPIVSCIFTVLLGCSMIYNRKALREKKLYIRLYLYVMFILSVSFLLFMNYWNFIGNKL